MNLNDLVLFAQAVESGGFAPAARRSATPKSTLSKRVAALEAAFGVRLIERSSRRFRLTEIGREVYEHARAALIEIESAREVVDRRLAEPSGTVRLTASVPVAQLHLAPHVPALARAFPKLRLEIHASDRFVDLVHEGFDVAVRSHFGPLPDSELVQRQVAVEPVLLVASPAYLAARAPLRRPRDLAQHLALLIGPRATTWHLRSAAGEEARVAPPPALVADESVVLINAAAAGLGVAPLPESIARGQLDSGGLVQVLPGWTAGTVTTSILVPHRRGQLPSVRAVVEFLAQRLARRSGAGPRTRGRGARR